MSDNTTEQKKMFKIDKIEDTSKGKIGNLSMLVYGKSGTGKTRFSLNGSRRAIVINLDNGLASVEDGQDVVSISIAETGYDMLVGIRQAYEYVRDNIKDYDLLVFDTYGQYTRELLAFYQSTDDGSDEGKKWGMKFSAKLFEAHSDFMSLDIDKVFVFHEEVVTSEMGIDMVSPAANGGKFKEALPSFYDIVVNFTLNKQGESVGSTGSVKVVGKNRYLSRVKDFEDKVIFGSDGVFSTFQEFRDYLNGKGLPKVKKEKPKPKKDEPKEPKQKDKEEDGI